MSNGQIDRREEAVPAIDFGGSISFPDEIVHLSPDSKSFANGVSITSIQSVIKLIKNKAKKEDIH